MSKQGAGGQKDGGYQLTDEAKMLFFLSWS